MSNFFRDTSLGFKPRSNIFSKLRVKEPDSHENSLTEDADSSLIEDLFLQSNHNHTESHSSLTTANQSDDKVGNKFQLGSSTPIAVKKPNIIGDAILEEDDLEITEVRDVALANASKDDEEKHYEGNKSSGSNINVGNILPPHVQNSFTKNTDDMQSVDASSNDVLLEAFTNTQKICSNLKQELQRQHTENSKLKTQVQNYQVDNEKIAAKLSGYKKILNSLDEQFKSLLEQKKGSDMRLKGLKENHDTLKKKIDCYKKNFTEFQSSISEFKSLKKDSDAELAKRSKEIEYLKRELNDCSGQLSEEKIKNSSLIQEFSKIREEFKTTLTNEVSQKHLEVQSKLDALEKNIQDAFNVELKAQLSESRKSSFEGLTENISAANEVLSSNIGRTLTENLRILSDQQTKVQEQYVHILHTKYEEVQEKSLIDIKNSIASQATQIEDQFKMIIKALEKKISGCNTISSNLIANISEDFTRYRDQLTNCQDYESKIGNLQSEISSLQLQKSQALSSLGTKEAQFDDVSKTLRSKEIEISKHNDTEKELCKKVELLSDDVELYKNKCSRLKEENITLKANSENKIVVQGELLKAFQSENDTLKQRINILDETRQQYEKENSSRVDTIQRMNEQVQKNNVEMVQLKAHELELEEENRNLKNAMEDNKLNYEETNDEFKRLKQKVIVLEAEKQDIATEKLDLQDKIDELQKTMKALKQKPYILQKNERSNQKKVELKGDEMEVSNKEAGDTPSIYNVPKQETHNDSVKDGEGDEFDLSSSLNDDFELTNPSPIQIKPIKIKRGCTTMKPPNCSRKKLLLLDEEESTQLKYRWKKRRN